jgi:hypothetical protein
VKRFWTFLTNNQLVWQTLKSRIKRLQEGDLAIAKSAYKLAANDGK